MWWCVVFRVSVVGAGLLTRPRSLPVLPRYRFGDVRLVAGRTQFARRCCPFAFRAVDALLLCCVTSLVSATACTPRSFGTPCAPRSLGTRVPDFTYEDASSAAEILFFSKGLWLRLLLRVVVAFGDCAGCDCVWRLLPASCGNRVSDCAAVMRSQSIARILHGRCVCQWRYIMETSQGACTHFPH